MFMEIIAGAVALAFICLVVFMIVVLIRLRKVLKKSEKLVENSNELVLDVK